MRHRFFIMCRTTFCQQEHAKRISSLSLIAFHVRAIGGMRNDYGSGFEDLTEYRPASSPSLTHGRFPCFYGKSLQASFGKMTKLPSSLQIAESACLSNRESIIPETGNILKADWLTCSQLTVVRVLLKATSQLARFGSRPTEGGCCATLICLAPLASQSM